MARIAPKDYQIHEISIIVYAQPGSNRLSVRGQGKAPAYGLTIDDVKLFRVNKKDTGLFNGNFQKPRISGPSKLMTA